MMITSILLLTLLSINAAERFFVDDERVHRERFNRFKAEHSKVYEIHEEEQRFEVFKTTLKIIDERNALELARGGEEVHGITKFADWTQDEFNRLNGIKLPKSMDDLMGESLFSGEKSKEMLNKNIDNARINPVGSDASNQRRLDDTYCDDPPKQHVNWIGKLTTSVKNQGQCGSCWAFTTVEQIESDLMRDHGVKLELAPTQLVQCDPFNDGCYGGNLDAAFEYTQAVGGISLESEYPYDDSVSSGKTGFCKPSVANGVATVINYSSLNYNATSGGSASPECAEKYMANYIFQKGPIALYVDAAVWNTYTGGVLTSCGSSVNHAVQAVGLNLEADVPYWIVRNSWGGDWGNNGYIYIKYGEDLCKLTYQPMVSSTALGNIADAF